MTRNTLLAVTLAFSATATTALAADATFEKTLSVSASPTLTVSTGSGHIQVTPGSDNQIHIVGRIHSNWPASDAEAQQIVANPPITQSGNTIAIGAHGDSGLYNHVSIDYEITAPRATLLTAHSGSGSIEVAGIEHVASADTGSGSIHLSLAGSGDLKVHTGSGTIRVEGLTGALDAHTGSGAIEIAGNLTSGWHLSTGSGSIHLTLPGSARFNLDADTGSGSVEVAQPIVMQGTLNRHHVSGTVNGGGPTIRATTGSGNIVINGTSTVGQLRDNDSLHVLGATDCVDNPSQPACRTN